MSGIEAIPILTVFAATANVALSAISVFKKKHLDVENTKTTEEIWKEASEELEQGIKQLQEYHKYIDISMLQPLHQAWEDCNQRVRIGRVEERACRKKKATFGRFRKIVNERKGWRQAALTGLDSCKAFHENVVEASIVAVNRATILKKIDEGKTPDQQVTLFNPFTDHEPPLGYTVQTWFPIDKEVII